MKNLVLQLRTKLSSLRGVKRRSNLSFVQILFLLSLLLTSCKFFKAEPLESYLDEYTNSAAIVRHTFSEEYPKDKNGIINIPSANDLRVDLLLRNPQKYTIECVPELLNTQTQKVRAQITNQTTEKKDPYTFTQDKLDITKSIAYLDFSSDFLKDLDGNENCDISSTFILTGYTSDGIKRVFENQPYSDFIAKVNTPPEPVRNLVILQDNKTNTYVIAFNMPDMLGIHKDICKIIINGTEYPVSPSEKNETGIDITNKTMEMFSTDSKFGESLGSGTSEELFSGLKQPRFVFYKTNKSFTQEKYEITVILEDKLGLQASSKVNTQSEKLNLVTFDETLNDNLEADDEGYATVLLHAPKITEKLTPLKEKENPTIFYEVKDVFGNIAKSGSSKEGTSDLELALGTGKWSIETWAQLDGYISSDVSSKTVQVVGVQYVDPNYNGTEKNGGKLTPFTSIQEAINTALAIEQNLIVLTLLDDITISTPINIKDFALSIKSENKTITGDINLSAEKEENTSFKVQNTNITGKVVLSEEKTNIYIQGSSSVQKIEKHHSATIYLDNIDLTQYKDGKHIATVAYIGSDELSKDVVICKATEGYKLPEGIEKLIKIDDLYYYATLSEDNCIVTKDSTISAEIPTSKKYKVIFQGEKLKEPQNATEKAYKIQLSEPDNVTKSTTVTAKLVQDNATETPVDNVQVTLDLSLANYIVGSGSIQTAKNSINISTAYVQAYILQANYTIDGENYSQSIMILVDDFELVPIADLNEPPSRITTPRIAMSTTADITKIADWMQNGSDLEGITIKLTENVDATELTDFVPIGVGVNDYFNQTDIDGGQGEVHWFNGVFDGNGKTIKLNVESGIDAQQVSLFAVNNGTIQNVVVEQFSESGIFGSSDQACGTRVAGICIFNNGIIKNCLVKADMQHGCQGDMAGICINNNGTIINCGYTGVIENTRNMPWANCCIQRVAGIAANNNGIIINCINTGTLINTYVDSSTYVQGPTGGIVAMQTSKSATLEPKVQNCYWRFNNCKINDEFRNLLVNKTSTTFGTGYESFHPNPTPETITACGYFESLDLPVAAGDENSCGIDQTLSYPEKTTVIDKLNAFVEEDTTYGDLKKWKALPDNKLAFVEE